MHSIVVADTSCFVVLEKIEALILLHQLYEQVLTTPEVAHEFGAPLPGWVTVKEVQDLQSQSVLESQLDKGEASAISLALELINVTVVLDELKGRKVAQKLGLTLTGTVGLIVKAKLQGLIPSIKPFMAKMSSTNFRLSAALLQKALQQAAE